MGGIVGQEHETGQTCHRPDEGKAQHKHNYEDDEPSYVLLADAVVDPGAVMVVLLYAHPAYIAVVASLGVLIFAYKAYFLYRSLVVVLKERLHSFGLIFGVLAEQGYVVCEHDGHECDLGVEDDIVGKVDEKIDDGQVDDEGDHE